jgi:DNA-binding CsgD family transcriptional regulator
MKINELLEALSKKPTADEEAKIRKYKADGKLNKDIDLLMGKKSNWTAGMISSHMRDLIQKVQVGRLVTSQDVERMLSLIRAGKTMDQIAQMFGVSRNLVTQRLKAKMTPQEYTARTQDKGALLTHEDELQIVKRFKETPNVIKIGRELGISQHTVRDRLNTHMGKEVVDQILASRWSEDSKEFVRQQYASGIGPTAITALLNKSLKPEEQLFNMAQVQSVIQQSRNYRELQSQYHSNKSLHREPESFTANVYRAGRMDPTKRTPDWRRGGYK